jgi:hypothetical protein
MGVSLKEKREFHPTLTALKMEKAKAHVPNYTCHVLPPLLFLLSANCTINHPLLHVNSILAIISAAHSLPFSPATHTNSHPFHLPPVYLPNSLKLRSAHRQLFLTGGRGECKHIHNHNKLSGLNPTTKRYKKLFLK